MKLYFHVDRTCSLKNGDTVTKEPYRSESVLPSLMPFADETYLRHIDKISREGLSIHGARYLIKVAHENINTLDFLLELQFEYIRNIYYKSMPSRFQSMFAFSEYEQALRFKQDKGNTGIIYEIDFSGRCFVGDMNWLKPDLNPETQKYNAKQYWEGKPYSSDKTYEPYWECVIDLPVKIIREIVN